MMDRSSYPWKKLLSDQKFWVKRQKIAQFIAIKLDVRLTEDLNFGLQT